MHNITWVHHHFTHRQSHSVYYFFHPIKSRNSLAFLLPKLHTNAIEWQSLHFYVKPMEISQLTRPHVFNRFFFSSLTSSLHYQYQHPRNRYPDSRKLSSQKTQSNGTAFFACTYQTGQRTSFAVFTPHSQEPQMKLFK